MLINISEELRTTGSGIAVQANGWIALDQLGVASNLRLKSTLLHGVRDLWLDTGRKQLISIGEARCVKRNDLVEALADDLPPRTIRFGCQILSVKSDTITPFSILHLNDGSTVRAKVLIGCDGANSVVADFLELKPKKVFSSCAVRGYTNYPNGHGLLPELVRSIRGTTLSGTVPINDNLVFWFVVQKWNRKDSMVWKDPELIREMTLEAIKGFPAQEIEMVKNCDLTSLSFTHLRYRAPWHIGGSAAMEDAVVLARCLARKMQANINMYHDMKGVEEGIDEYVKERRMRLVQLSTQTYLLGSLVDNWSSIVRFMIILLLALLFRNPFGHNRYNVGRL
ncbi:hypothetical protein ACOSP7_008952 [Xanthoceras sorbifolium]